MPDTALHRVQGMRQALGLARMPEDADETSELVARCRTCSKPGACAKWLDALEIEAPRAPAYCVNRGRLEGERRAGIDAARAG